MNRQSQRTNNQESPSPSKPKIGVRLGIFLSILILVPVLTLFAKFQEEKNYRLLKSEAQSLGVLITPQDFQDQRNSLGASEDITNYNNLLNEFNQNPVLEVDGSIKIKNTPAFIRQNAPQFFEDVAYCTSIPTIDTRDYSPTNRPLYNEHKFIAAIPKILANDILADIQNQNVPRAKKTSESLYGWFKFLDLRYEVNINSSHFSRKQWLDAAENFLKQNDPNSPQSKTLKEIIAQMPPPPSIRGVFLAWHAAPTNTPLPNGETMDEYGQRLFEAHRKTGKFANPIDLIKNYPYFCFSGYAERNHKLLLIPLVRAIKTTPESADDITFAKAIDTEFRKDEATKKPGWVEFNDGIPDFYTYMAKQRQDLIDRQLRLSQ